MCNYVQTLVRAFITSVRGYIALSLSLSRGQPLSYLCTQFFKHLFLRSLHNLTSLDLHSLHEIRFPSLPNRSNNISHRLNLPYSTPMRKLPRLVHL